MASYNWPGNPSAFVTGIADTATIDLVDTAGTLTANIVALSITNAYISASAGIEFSKLATLTSGNILVGSAGNVATSVAMSGDITISNAGVTAIGTGVIVNGDISGSAAIDYSKLAALTSGNILVGNGSNVATSVAMTGDITISNAGVTAIGTGVIVNADVSGSAAIDRSKLASGTNYRILANSAAGVMSENAALTAAGVTYADANGQLATAATLVFDGTNGRLGIGTGASAAAFDLNGATQTSVLALGAEDGANHAEAALHRHGNSAAIGAAHVFIRSRGTEASPTIVSDGDILGRCDYGGYNGVDYSYAASIRIAVDGTPADNVMPARMSFWLTPAASQTPVEALRIGPTKLATFYGATVYDTLTASTVPYLDAGKQLTSSAVTPTELGYVSGVTSAIQTQLTAKAIGAASSTANAVAKYSTTDGKTLLNSGIIIDGSNNVSGFGNLTMTTGTLSLTTGKITVGNGPGSFADPRVSVVNSSTSSGDIAAYGLLSTRTDIPRTSGFCWLVVTSSGPSIGMSVTTSSTWASSKYALVIDPSTTAITFGEGTTQVHRWNGATQTTVGAAGGASALPATPTGYIEVNVNGTARVIPYYAKS